MGEEETKRVVRMGDYTPFCNTYSDEEEFTLLQEYKRFDEKPLDKKLKKWVEFRKVCSVKPDYTVVQLSKKVRGFCKKFEDKKNSPLPTDPHKARIFQLSTSIWGDAINKRALHADHVHKPLKKIKVEEVGDGLKELRVRELHLYHQSLLLEMEKQKLKLQLLKLGT